MRNSPLKQFVIFTVGSALNAALFFLTKYTGFPLWLDFTGSMYITVAAGPVFGCASLLLHTLLLTLLIDGSNALWLLIPGVLCCSVLYALKQLGMFAKAPGYIGAMLITAASGTVGNFLIFAINKYPPSRYASALAALSDMKSAYGGFIGTVMLSAALAFAELVPSLILFSAAYFATPRQKRILSFKK